MIGAKSNNKVKKKTLFLSLFFNNKPSITISFKSIKKKFDDNNKA